MNSTYIVQGEGIVEAAILKETKDTNLIIFITIPSILKVVPNLEGERERKRENKERRERREGGERGKRENKRGKKGRGGGGERELKTEVSIHSVTYNSTPLCSREELLIIPANVAKGEKERERAIKINI